MSRPTVLITGAAIRLGKATAEAFFARGCNLILHYNSSDNAAKKLQKNFNEKRCDSCEIIQADLSDSDNLMKLIDQSNQTFGRLDHLVNNASLFYPTPFYSTSFDDGHEQEQKSTIDKHLSCEIENQDLDTFLTVNYQSPAKLARLAYPLLKQQQGSIINLIDIYADAGLSKHTAYVTSKAALKQMTQIQAAEFAPKVRVNGVSPGAILWPDQDEENTNQESQDQASGLKSKDNGKTEILNNTASHKLGSPANIASTIVFLALEASYTTGSIIKVDSARRWYI